MGKRNFTNRSKRSIKRNRRNKRRLTNRYNKSRRGGYTKIRGGMNSSSRGLPRGPPRGTVLRATPSVAPRLEGATRGMEWRGNVYVPGSRDVSNLTPVKARLRSPDSAADSIRVVAASPTSSTSPTSRVVARPSVPVAQTTYPDPGSKRSSQLSEVRRFQQWKAQHAASEAKKATTAVMPDFDTGSDPATQRAHLQQAARKIQLEQATVAALQHNWDEARSKTDQTENINAWVEQMDPFLDDQSSTDDQSSSQCWRPLDVGESPVGTLIKDQIRYERDGKIRGLNILQSLPKRHTTANEDKILFVIDMQNDFVGPDGFAPNWRNNLECFSMMGARFAVSEGNHIDDKIANLIREWPGIVILSRDYHPNDHCSFATQQGNYPTHCVEGTKGSYFTSNIERALIDRMKDVKKKPEGPELTPEQKSFKRDRTYIVFKGCWKNVDSYGAAKYNIPGGNWGTAASPDYVWSGQSGVSKNKDPVEFKTVFPTEHTHSSCGVIDLTGSYYLKCSALAEIEDLMKYREEDASEDEVNQCILNALRSGPDVNAINEKNQLNSEGNMNNTLEDLLKNRGSGEDTDIYVVGLALDYCCTDTCVNLRKNGFQNVHLIMNLCRPPVIARSNPKFAYFNTEAHHVDENTEGDNWLTKRIAQFRKSEDLSEEVLTLVTEKAEEASVDTSSPIALENFIQSIHCPAWWLLSEIKPSGVNLIWGKYT